MQASRTSRLFRFLIIGLAAALSFPACAQQRDPPRPSLASTLPALQTNVGGDPRIEWRYANSVLGFGVSMLDVSSGAQSADRFKRDPGLLDPPLTEGGWPRELEDGIVATLSTGYMRKADPAPGELRSDSYENLTGLYVVTWKGRTIPDREGKERFWVLDTINDGDPTKGTRILPAGDHRIIALVRDKDRGANVRYEKPDPSDPIRDIKVWTPLFMGAGLGADLRDYDEARLGPGRLKAWNTEPAPGEADPLWHPQYLKHLREDPSGVLRFMNFLDINDLDRPGAPRQSSWSDRKSASYTLGELIGLSPSNWERHPAASFRGGGQVPYEWIFDLCKQVGKDPWIQVPHTASPEYVAGLASLAAASLPKGRRLWFEFSNELWNGAGWYLPQYKAAEAEGRRNGKDQGWGSGRLQGLAIQAFEKAWLKAGRSGDELINVVSGFAVSADYNDRVLAGVEAVSRGLPEALAITTYFGAGLTAELYGLPYGKGNPDAEVYAQAKAVIRRDLYATSEWWKATARLCSARGIPMIAYEGGSHVLPSGFGDWNNPSHAAFMTFLANLHKHRVMLDLYIEQWALWEAAGGCTASVWYDIGQYGYYGYWGAKEDVTESLDRSPRARAMVEYVKARQGIRALGDSIGTRPVFVDPAPLRGEVGAPFSFDFALSGGDGRLTTIVLGGDLPPGLAESATPSGGLRLQGAPAASGQYRFILRASDRDGDPAYAVVEMIVDPKGASGGRLLLFDPRGLPLASLSKSENREEYRSRFDVSPSRARVEDAVGGSPRLLVPFDGDAPLFGAHYIDPTVALESSSPYAFSGGLALTLLKDDFFAANPGVTDSAGTRNLSPSGTTTILWFGYRDRRLAAQLGSSLDLKPDKTHSQERRYGVPTRFDALLIWRANQFEARGGRGAAFGRGEEQSALVLESGGIGADSATWRFVIRRSVPGGGVRYYLSEASWKQTAAGRFSLSDFNDNPRPGKRWAEFQPKAAAFDMPPEKDLKYQAVDFTDVDGVGVAIRSQRFGWHYDMGITRFLVIGKKQ